MFLFLYLDFALSLSSFVLNTPKIKPDPPAPRSFPPSIPKDCKLEYRELTCSGHIRDDKLFLFSQLFARWYAILSISDSKKESYALLQMSRIFLLYWWLSLDPISFAILKDFLVLPVYMSSDLSINSSINSLLIGNGLTSKSPSLLISIEFIPP